MRFVCINDMKRFFNDNCPREENTNSNETVLLIGCLPSSMAQQKFNKTTCKQRPLHDYVIFGPKYKRRVLPNILIH